MISSYSDLLTQITRLMDGEDVSASELATATLEQVVGLAEKRIYRELRSRFNEKAFTGVTVTGNLAPIPADFEASSVVRLGKQPLQPVAENWIREYNVHGAAGECLYFAEAGASFMFAPAVTDGTVLQGRYFCRLPDLTRENFSANALVAREGDLFIYAALSEGAPFFQSQSTPPQVWEAKYQAIRDRLNSDKQRTAASAGRLIVRNSARVVR